MQKGLHSSNNRRREVRFLRKGLVPHDSSISPTESGCSAEEARSHGVRKVAGSIPASPTINMNIERISLRGMNISVFMCSFENMSIQACINIGV